MDRMSPLDAAFLELEDADCHASLHVASVGIFEGPAPTYDELLAAFAGKLPLVPRYRQRARRVPLELAEPVWVDYPGFDPRYHVRHTALPAPGSAAQLEELVGRLMSTRLDRDHPLWEAWLVDGLADGAWALVSKVHHCLVDGVSGTDLLTVMFDLTPEPSPPVPDGWDPAPEPSDLRLLVDAVGDAVRQPVRAAADAVRLVRSPRAAAGRVAASARGLAGYATALRPSGRTSLRGPLHAPRRWTVVRASVEDVRVVRRAYGGTFNDVVVAAVSTGFRELLLSRQEEPPAQGIRTLVPVNVRKPGEESILDNRVSAMVADLPVHLPDPVERHAEVRRRLERLKHSGETAAGVAVTALARYAPFELLGAGLRAVFRGPQWYLTTVATNVPGPPFPLYVLGRRMLEAFPYVPIGDKLRVGVSNFSYCGQLTFGLTADRDSVPDLDVLARGIEAGIADLAKSARELLGEDPPEE